MGFATLGNHQSEAVLWPSLLLPQYTPEDTQCQRLLWGAEQTQLDSWHRIPLEPMLFINGLYACPTVHLCQELQCKGVVGQWWVLPKMWLHSQPKLPLASSQFSAAWGRYNLNIVYILTVLRWVKIWVCVSHLKIWTLILLSLPPVLHQNNTIGFQEWFLIYK